MLYDCDDDDDDDDYYYYLYNKRRYVCLSVCLLVRERSALATIIFSRRVYLSGCLSGCQDVCPSFQNASSPAFFVRLS